MLRRRPGRRVLAGVALLAATIAVPVAPAAAATGSISFAAASTAVGEDGGAVNITLTRTDTTDEVTVDYVVAGANDDGAGGLEARSRLEHATAVSAEDVAERVQLVVVGEGPGDRATVGGAMQQRTAGGKAQRSSTHGLVDELTHLGDLVRRGRCLVQ